MSLHTVEKLQSSQVVSSIGNATTTITAATNTTAAITSSITTSLVSHRCVDDRKLPLLNNMRDTA